MTLDRIEFWNKIHVIEPISLLMIHNQPKNFGTKALSGVVVVCKWVCVFWFLFALKILKVWIHLCMEVGVCVCVCFALGFLCFFWDDWIIYRVCMCLCNCVSECVCWAKLRTFSLKWLSCWVKFYCVCWVKFWWENSYG